MHKEVPKLNIKVLRLIRQMRVPVLDFP